MERWDKFNLRLPPIVVMAIAAIGMWPFPHWVQSAQFDFPGRVALCYGLLATGGFATASGVFEFRQARTTVDPTRPGAASSLITTGVYKRTRNPMYLGFALILVAWGIYLANLACLVLVGAFVAFITRFQIIPEERILASKFGPAFLKYRANTRRWL